MDTSEIYVARKVTMQTVNADRIVETSIYLAAVIADDST